MTPEGLIKRQICEFLTYKHPEIMFWMNDSKGTWDPTRKVFRKKTRFERKGVLDILGVLPGGQAFACEVKTKTGRISPEQKTFIAEFNAKGGFAFVARSVEDVDEAFSNLVHHP